MLFSILDRLPENAAAILFVSNGKVAPEDGTSALLLEGLAEQEYFAAARIPEGGSLKHKAVLRVADNGLPAWQKAAKEAAAWAQHQEEVFIDLSAVCLRGVGMIAETLYLACGEAAYRFNRFKTGAKPAALKHIRFVHPEFAGEIQAALDAAAALLYGTNLCKDLANTAPNYCTPEYLAAAAASEAEQLGATAKIIGKDYIREHMGAFWSVAKGSVQEPRLIELSYNGAADPSAPPVVLVGKGITFDSGGISLKPGEAMDEMKYDMGGAACMIGTFIAAVKARLPLNLVAVVPTCENMPDGGASKPGDIVTAMNGTTVEILNTDAEGRLILCDALTYAERFKPRFVIDAATLTGACIIALGHAASGLLSNDQELADLLLAASRETNDKAWQLPLFDEYKEQLKSNFADLQNIGGRPAGTITAATFLAHFTQNYRWAHLDIAGTAWKSGREKGATGRPVALLMRFLKNLADAA